MSPALPEDVWRCVASFLPPLNIHRLISVNQACYNIAMDLKYQQVEWKTLDRWMLRSLVRLRTTEAARRVRRLHIRAWFIEYLIQKESLTTASRAAITSSKRWFSRLLTPQASSSLIPQKITTAHEILDAMTAALRLMTQVTEYSFEWRDLPPTSDTLRLLTTARTAFGISLRKLTLRAQLCNYKALVSTVDFDGLEELELHFDHDNGVEDGPTLLRETIAPFINHFRRTISSLRITGVSNTDLASLFHALEVFPHLRKLATFLTFDETHLSDPSGLVRVLRRNSDTLTDLELGWSYALSSDSADKPPSTWPAFKTAFTADSTLLAHLCILTMPMLDTFTATLACLQRSADTLTHLTLLGHFLNPTEFAELVQVFAHRPFDAGLNSLTVGIAYLAVDILDLLASRLPGLNDLNLIMPDNLLSLLRGLHDEPDSFCHTLLGRKYPDWQLTNLGIYTNRLVSPPVYVSDEFEMMQHLAWCVPNVKTFKGEDMGGSPYHRSGPVWNRCPLFDTNARS
ncbi:hypothetical protein FB45DRAFT_900652 [Roridomyces roridus]|uniref:F-box domain-containing protein n=1 Tax=Roridomyces roridus TaxID=1738132 RepID=A0AAD7C826_9AGAR|nr:hypothetical protein FB45DRAFT_900652 [Roridomyces roridus]